MLNKAVLRLHIDGNSDHASREVDPEVCCRWRMVWGPKYIPVAHHNSTHVAQVLIS